MYENSFGLKRRPFAATPDATCFRSSEPIRAALDEIVVCVEHGQGIAVLTAPAGTGKTLLCERLRCELDDRFETVFLRHASFLTRRALLQTILCELNSPYHHPSEQELRLELFPAIRALQPKREALVLICDEAHQLPDSLLEELRILADFAEAGRPLVRLVLVGQLSLEEKLAHPNLEAFNQRIRAHVNLSTFDHAGSLDYIDYRLTWAGGRTDEIFTPEALELIARVSDGVPRCINQLADHTLLLAFVAEQRPAGEQLVREALNDLRQLPLHWNEPPQSLSSDFSTRHSEPFVEIEDELVSPSVESHGSESNDRISSPSIATYSYEPEPDFTASLLHDVPVVEEIVPASRYISHDEITFEGTASHDGQQLDVGSDDWRRTLELFNSQLSDTVFADNYSHLISRAANGPVTEATFQDGQFTISETVNPAIVSTGTPSAPAEPIESETIEHALPLSAATVLATAPSPVGSVDLQEEIVVDRYASIDAGLEPPVSPQLDTPIPDEVRLDQLVIELQKTHQPIETTLPAATTLEVTSELISAGIVAHESGLTSSWFNTPLPVAQRFEHLDAQPVVGEVFETDSEPGNSSSDSLLEAIRDEVDELASSVSQQSHEETSVESEPTAWESVETPLAPPQQEHRPFRYLFSKLRRKQQGLS